VKTTKRLLTVRKCYDNEKHESFFQVLKLEPGAGPATHLASQLTPGSVIYQQHVDLLRKRGWSVLTQEGNTQTEFPAEASSP
jgi:transposase InsO family protein